MSDFQPVSRTRVADQVAGAIRQAILRGEYPPGEKLPAERELAAQFDVNRSSVREALQRLEAWGLVDVRHGDGATVSDFLAQSGLHLLPWLLAPSGQLDPKLMRDLLEVRVPLFVFTAEQAALRATDTDIADLEAAVAALEAATDVDSIQTADFVFFQELIAASDNRVLTLISVAIGAAYLENREAFANLYPGAKVSTGPYRDTVKAIKARNPKAAGRSIRRYAEQALAAFET